MNKDIVLPKFREDILVELFEQSGSKFVSLSDPLEIALQPVALPAELAPVLSLFDGINSVNELSDSIKNETGEDPDLSFLVDLCANLDYLGYLVTDRFLELKTDNDSYYNSNIRPATCVGSSYSADPLEAMKEIDAILNTPVSIYGAAWADAVLVPHIDFRIGKIAHECYSAAYKAIAGADAGLFVIFGTAHRGNSDYFMLTEKDFSSPLGIVETDRELIGKLRSALGDGLTIDDHAHRFEHSIEYQVALLQRAFPGRKFTILPILAGSLYTFSHEKKIPESDPKYSAFIDTLRRIISESGRKAVYIASGDLAHIGRKFDDDFDAAPVLPELKKEDKKLLENIQNCDLAGLFNTISAVDDKWKICGFPPVYALLSLLQPQKGKFLVYNQWNEKATRSAVSFATVAFFKD